MVPAPCGAPKLDKLKNADNKARLFALHAQPWTIDQVATEATAFAAHLGKLTLVLSTRERS